MSTGAVLDPQPLGLPPCELGEGPVWLADQSRLAWVDINGRTVHSIDPYKGSATHRTVRFPEAVTCLAPTDDGKFVAGTSSGVALIDEHGSLIRLATTNDPDVRMNDGACDPSGQFVVGSTGLEFEPGLGALYALVAPGQLTKLIEGVTISNGLAWPDHETMYYIDTPTRRIDVYDYDQSTPSVHRRATVVDIPEQWGLPDGMCLDAEGNLWTAFWGGGAVRSFSPDGELLEVIRLPVTNVTNCAFAGPDLRALFVTTAVSGRGDALEGDVFVIEMPVTGRQTAGWAGVDGIGGLTPPGGAPASSA